jgi:AraC-like DNA-binding protein
MDDVLDAPIPPLHSGEAGPWSTSLNPAIRNPAPSRSPLSRDYPADLRQSERGLSAFLLRRAMEYIDEHLDAKLRLPEIARVVQLSPCHFARQFKHASGFSPHQFVVRRRIMRGAELLVSTQLSLGEIALEIGCSDQSHFTTLFRKTTGMTPRAFRDRVRTALSTAPVEPD